MLQAQRLPEALTLLTEACRLSPNDAHAWNVLGAINGNLCRLEEAMDCTRRSLALQPDNADAQNNLGIMLEKLTRHGEATACYRKAIALDRNHVGAHKNLGNQLNAAGDHANAITHYEFALRRAPRHTGLHNDLGNALLAAGRMDEAQTHYLKALEIEPGFARARSNLASLQSHQGQFDDAITSNRHALEQQPDDAGIHHNLGELLQKKGQLMEALSHYDAALRLLPDFAEAHNHRGTVLQLLGHFDEAENAYSRALALQPNYAYAHLHLGNLHQECGRFEAALNTYNRALTCQSEMAEAWNNIGGCLLLSGQYRQSIEAHGKALTLQPDNQAMASNHLLALNYDPGQTVHTLAAAHRQWGNAFPRTTPGTPHPMRAGRRLRIGYVSPDFRTHSVAYFIEPVLLAHDPARFEVFCYAEVLTPDTTTQRLRETVPHWRDTCGLSDETVAGEIRQDKIDILVDLAGHTQRNRLGVFALHPAPVQISYLGYPNTTGLATMDYRLTDARADPPGQDDSYTEQLYRLPAGFLCYRPPHDAPAVVPSPSEANGYITFASFNNLAKVNEDVITAWAEILRDVPRSRLRLKNRAFGDASVRHRYITQFENHGINAKRLHMSGLAHDISSHLALYGEVDIALDTFPYNGTTTSCEALWMGVPIISRIGDRHAGRVGISLLHRLGLEPLCAPDLNSYVALAIKLANNPDKLHIMRDNLRQLMMISLCDAPTFTHQIEQAYTDIWSKTADSKL